MPRRGLALLGSLTGRIAILFLGGVLPILLLSSLLSLLRDFSPVQAQFTLPGMQKVAPDVIEALQAEHETYVVIALAMPISLSRQTIDLNKAKNDVTGMQNSVLAAVDSSDFLVTHKYEAVPALAGKLVTESGLYALAANPNVRKIDLDVGGTGSLATTVPLIGADTWHSVDNLGDGVVVAVLDSGLDSDHSDLAPAIIHQECFLDNGGTVDGIGLCPNGSDRQSGPGAAEDDAGHGTHVTGIIGSRGQQSSPGVAPGVSIVSIKVTSGPEFSGEFFYFSEIIAALDYIIANRPDVQIVNMSLVTIEQFSGDCDNATSWNMAGASAVNTLRSQGVISFASSGNNGSGSLMNSPACLSNVISVGATTNNDLVASLTNSNSSTDILAPGIGIVSSALGNGTMAASGTSMASAHAAGCAALLIAAREAVTPDQIEERLETSLVQILNSKNDLTLPRIECALKLLDEVEISGPVDGYVGDDYSFVASAIPVTATQPITYNWQATDQPPLTITGNLSDTASFSWDTPGDKVISITAENIAVSVTNVHTITVDVAPAAGHITGTVTAETGGVPLANKDVCAFFDNGADWQAAGCDITTVSGSYDIDGLPAGTYRVEFSDSTGFYRLEYYDNALDFNSAANVSVTTDSKTVNIDAALEPAGTQIIALAAGWNMISSYVDPDYPALETVLTDIESDMVLMKNSSGEVYWPAQTINTIGDWDVRDGYQIYMNNPAILAITGQAVDPMQTVVELSSGWSLVAYLRETSMPVDQALISMGDDLDLAKNGLGLIYWPGYGVNTIGDMQPGQGYQMYLNAPVTLTYPAN